METARIIVHPGQVNFSSRPAGARSLDYADRLLHLLEPKQGTFLPEAYFNAAGLKEATR